MIIKFKMYFALYLGSISLERLWYQFNKRKYQLYIVILCTYCNVYIGIRARYRHARHVYVLHTLRAHQQLYSFHFITFLLTRVIWRINSIIQQIHACNYAFISIVRYWSSRDWQENKREQERERGCGGNYSAILICDMFVTFGTQLCRTLHSEQMHSSSSFAFIFASKNI